MKKYQIIYADPPWKYRSTTSPNQIGKYKTQKARNNYQTMTFDEIYSLPIKEITDDNCALFLWTTFPLLIGCIKTFEKWGFIYKTVAFNWTKLNKNNNRPYFGTGYYTKANSEVCLLGIKGKMKPISNFISSIILQPREEHSKKPTIARDNIVELFGDLPRIELFARQKTKGWDVWGNEVKNDIWL